MKKENQTTSPLSVQEVSSGKTGRQDLAARYRDVRLFTENLCRPLAIEDYVIQSMPDVSPTKWHLAHTSWFFETFVLSKVNSRYQSPHPKYTYLFNSYYVQVGERYARAQRGLLSRPTVDEVFQYRRHVDRHMNELFDTAPTSTFEAIAPVVELGLNHEQQHQELMITDIKHVFSINPLHTVYRERPPAMAKDRPGPIEWVTFPEGLYWIGQEDGGFAFDNESPRHRVWLTPFAWAHRPVTNREYLAFIEDGGYRRPELWMSDGWNAVQTHGWQAPLYWEEQDKQWWYFTLSGRRTVEWDEPVCHVSYYEADAFARWVGARLPSEAEWEVAAAPQPIEGNFVESGLYHVAAAPAQAAPRARQQIFGDVWEWTQSPYAPYPGYKTLPGALGEYNGKFMCNQMVLRGGSCATPQSHLRATYRNFFPPEARWQFMGIRLARDIELRS